jgi:hypothetical protein
MNSQRYRLQGFRYQNGQVSLQARPVQASEAQRVEAATALVLERVTVSTGR